MIHSECIYPLVQMKYIPMYIHLVLSAPFHTHSSTFAFTTSPTEYCSRGLSTNPSAKLANLTRPHTSLPNLCRSSNREQRHHGEAGASQPLKPQAMLYAEIYTTTTDHLHTVQVPCVPVQYLHYFTEAAAVHIIHTHEYIYT